MLLPLNFNVVLRPEFINGGKTGIRYRTDPLSRVEMTLHDNVADRLINIAEGKHKKKWCMKIKIREIYKWKHHKLPECNLHNRTKSGISGRTVGVVLCPVSHTNDGGNAVNDKHASTNFI